MKDPRKGQRDGTVLHERRLKRHKNQSALSILKRGHTRHYWANWRNLNMANILDSIMKMALQLRNRCPSS